MGCSSRRDLGRDEQGASQDAAQHHPAHRRAIGDLHHEIGHRVGRAAGHGRLCQQRGQQQRCLPQISALALAEEERGVAGCGRGQQRCGRGQHNQGTRRARDAGDEPCGADPGEGAQHPGAPHKPGSAVGPGQQVVEAGWLFQVPHQQHTGDGQEESRDQRRHDSDRGLRVAMAQQHQQSGHGHHAGGDRFGDEIARHLGFPGHLVGRGVGSAGHHAATVGRDRRVLGRGVGPDHAVGRDGRAQRVQRRLVGAPVVHLGQGLLLGGPHRGVAASDDLGGLVIRVI